ncbi:nucleoside triphosphate pyrophosphohydrolase [Terasakiispira papahanaumokuakeensis]|uniref:Nucleoside triphosphate pyrophosphohydrolase n=1 Tax=Terasakiispira papahanaumokuakeensis TaxID=197479 RepID=A0A1E2V893_9GAMM|nr:nucleoside triphosphate pyrophosphohydrolase [Terasakiispira papahanaumokuakeensis]ODC02875.1 nucleoside triphosphate pyrophosphohydrolase [Terasakiispira papahanaumokuakeensis]
MAQTRYHLDDLITLMARLRDPQAGCPWDLKQTWDSIVPHTLEEAYEVADCIEQADFEHLRSELGDLLFQVVYYSRFAEEEQRFDLHDVVDGLTRKMIRRHPHVFPDGTLKGHGDESLSTDADGALHRDALNSDSLREGPSAVDEAQVKSRWESIKAEERASQSGAVSVLDDVPRALPAITRAIKLQKRAASVGFDWDQPLQVMDKLEEELAEIREALSQGDQAAVADEVGDLMFAVANLARHLKVDPEQALRGTNHKFERRFRFIEQAFKAQGRSLSDADLEAMEAQWQAAKALESSTSS